MKKLFYLFFFLSLSFSSNAQVNLDSLLNIWNDNTKADTIRLEAVYYFIHDGLNNEFGMNVLYEQNTDSLLALTERVHKITEASGSKKYQTLEVRLKGIHNKQIKNYPEAVKLFTQALEMARKQKDKRLIVLSMVTLANCETSWALQNGGIDSTRIAQGEKHFLEALNLLEQESVNSNVVASKIDPQLSHYAFKALYSLGHVNLLLNISSKGITYLEKALVIAEQSGNNSDASYALSLLGIAQAGQYDILNARQNLEKAVILAGQSGDEKALEFCMGMLGNFLKAQGNYPAAIRYYTKCLILAEQKGDNYWKARNLLNLGGLYNEAKEFSKAEDYLTGALTSMQAAGTRHQNKLKDIYIGLHNCYIGQKHFSKATANDSTFFKFAGEFDLSSVPAALLLLAENYHESGDSVKALEYGFQGLKANDEMEINLNRSQLRNNLVSIIGKTYLKQNLFTKAIIWCEKANNTQDVWIQKDACECLYEAHKGLKNNNEALAYHEKFLVLTDSLNTNELGKTLQQMEFSKQIVADSLVQESEKRKVQMAHQAEVRKKNKTRNIFLGAGILLFVLTGGLFSRLKYIRKSKAVLQVEKDRSENLLLNILPAEVAEELKLNGKAVAKDFDKVSIIFTDFKSFTEMSEKLSASELVGELNYCFKGFDGIMEKHSIEKIKTIGDAYMAAGGLPVSTDDSTKNTVKAALEMQKFITDRKVEQDKKGLPSFEMRVGVHTGPIVAGIVGVKKFQYDIWGDTVNTASRMENAGEVGQVNISKDTYEQIKDEPNFSFSSRGKIEVKGKGELQMYFVT